MGNIYMTTITIPIHSFVDLITNSSSEIFVCASKSTVTAIKKLVNNIISASTGYNVAVAYANDADALFNFELVTKCYTPNGDEVYLTKEEIVAKRAELEKNNGDKEYPEEDGDEWVFFDDDSDTPQSAVRVTVKNKDNKAAEDAAKVLSDLTALFVIDVGYN